MLEPVFNRIIVSFGLLSTLQGRLFVGTPMNPSSTSWNCFFPECLPPCLSALVYMDFVLFANVYYTILTVMKEPLLNLIRLVTWVDFFLT
jgi:hypothetical protein